MIVLFLAVIFIFSKCASELISLPVCLQSTPKSILPIFNYHRPVDAWFNQTLYLGAAYPNFAAPALNSDGKLLVGDRMTVVLVQRKSMEATGPVCDEAVREKSSKVLDQLVRENHIITPNIFATQTRLFANLVVFGKHLSVAENGEKYYQLVKMDSQYVAEIPANFEEAADSLYNFYWFQWVRYLWSMKV